MRILRRLFWGAGLVLVLGVAALGVAVSYDTACPAPSGSTAGERSMRAVIYQCYGPPEVLEVATLPVPEPEPDQVLVKIRHAAVNPMDWHKMRGSPYLLRLATGLGAPERQRLGADFSGEVVQVGAEVTRFKPGDAVFGSQTGAYGEYVLVGEGGSIVHKPDNVPFEHAGVVAIAGVTALQALVDAGQVKAGDRVLVNGASGGVGTYVVQIAHANGATVTGVSSAPNHALVLGLGASSMIDYRTTNFTQQAQRYDLVVDMVGNHTPLEISEVLEPDGRLVLVGGPKGDWIGPLRNPLVTLLQSPLMKQEIHLLRARMSAGHLALLAGMMGRGEVTPVIGHRFPLERIREAMTLSETGRVRGKILLDIGAR